MVNGKLCRDSPGNPSKLGMEVLKRMANRETLGRKGDPSARPRVACLRRRCAANWVGCGQRLSVSWATRCLARSRLALRDGRGGRGILATPSLRERRCGVLAFVLSSSSVLHFSVEMQCLLVFVQTGLRTQCLARVCGIPIFESKISKLQLPPERSAVLQRETVMPQQKLLRTGVDSEIYDRLQTTRQRHMLQGVFSV